MIIERVRAGMANAKAKGVKIGRTKKRNSVLIRSLLEAKISYREIARIARCSHGSVHSEKIQMLKGQENEQRQKMEAMQKEIKESANANSLLKNENLPEGVVKSVKPNLKSKLELELKRFKEFITRPTINSFGRRFAF